MRFIGTLALAAVLFFGFMYLSGATYFIPLDTVLKMGFSTEQPYNILAHMVAHTGYAHMVENVATLVVFALIAEAALVSVDVLVIFALSGACAAALFSLLNPGVLLIGASAGISGLVGSALMLNPKKAFPAVVVVPLALMLAILPLANALFVAYHSSLEQQGEKLAGEISAARAQGDLQREQELAKELAVVEEREVQQEVGVKFQQETPTDTLVHAAGAAVGIGYLVAFRRKRLEEGLEKYAALVGAIALRARGLAGKLGLR